MFLTTLLAVAYFFLFVPTFFLFYLSVLYPVRGREFYFQEVQSKDPRNYLAPLKKKKKECLAFAGSAS